MSRASITPEIFDECLLQLQNGIALEKVLGNYPAQAVELRPLLETARRLSKAAGVPPTSTQQRSRVGFLEKAARLSLRNKVSFWRRTSLRLAGSIVLALGLVFSGIWGVTQTSASSLPGDSLYPVKRSVENMRLQFAPNDASRQNLVQEFDQRRKSEVHELIKDKRSAPVTFSGAAERDSSGDWTVNGVPVEIPQVDQSELSEGHDVEIEGVSKEDGRVWATVVQPARDTPTPTPSMTQQPATPESFNQPEKSEDTVNTEHQKSLDNPEKTGDTKPDKPQEKSDDTNHDKPLEAPGND